MKTRPLTETEKQILASELANAALADCHSKGTVNVLGKFETLIAQGKIRVVK